MGLLVPCVFTSERSPTNSEDEARRQGLGATTVSTKPQLGSPGLEVHILGDHE
jgi:hypothetical protein